MDIHTLLKTPLEKIKFCVVDTETSGMSPEFNRVIDIGIVQINEGRISNKWETLIDPKQDIPEWITKYTHLTTKDVKGQPTFDRILSSVEELLKDTVFIAHNVGFDYSFLSCEFKRLGKDFIFPKLCTVQLGRKLLPQLANAHLDALSDYYNIKITKRHRALPDAEATAEVFLKFIEIARVRHNIKHFFDLERLQRISVKKAAEQTDSKVYPTLGLFEF